jgi:hypothetical protein
MTEEGIGAKKQPESLRRYLEKSAIRPRNLRIGRILDTDFAGMTDLNLGP